MKMSTENMRQDVSDAIETAGQDFGHYISHGTDV